jgi:hypothetical protein
VNIDRADARILAQLLAEHFLPPVWLPISPRPSPFRASPQPSFARCCGCPRCAAAIDADLETRRASGGSGELALGMPPERGAAHHLGELLSEVCLRLQHRGEPVHLTHLGR